MRFESRAGKQKRNRNNEINGKYFVVITKTKTETKLPEYGKRKRKRLTNNGVNAIFFRLFFHCLAVQFSWDFWGRRFQICYSNEVLTHRSHRMTTFSLLYVCPCIPDTSTCSRAGKRKRKRKRNNEIKREKIVCDNENGNQIARISETKTKKIYQTQHRKRKKNETNFFRLPALFESRINVHNF